MLKVVFHYDKDTSAKIAEFESVLVEYTDSLYKYFREICCGYEAIENMLSPTDIHRIVMNNTTRLNILRQITKLHELSIPTRIELIQDNEDVTEAYKYPTVYE